MVELAGKKLADCPNRVSAQLGDGAFEFDDPTDTFDRFVAAYLLDVLDEDFRAALQEADPLLAEGGLFCIASLTNGAGPVYGFTS